ncbi:MAG: ATPase, partial [bacterium]
NVLGTFVAQKMTWKSITEVSKGLSHAEIDQACRDAIKQAILTDREAVDTPLLSSMLRERQDSHGKQRG